MNSEKIPYTLSIPTIYGQMLVNRHDIDQTNAFIKTGAAFDKVQIDFARNVCANGGEGGVVLDIGANFGAYTLACAQELAPLGGVVHAFEPQRILAYMLCGSISMNSIENAFVHIECVGNSNTPVDIPRFDYHQELNFGSIEFSDNQSEKLHQERLPSTEKVGQTRIDDRDFRDLKFVKIDVEGMESTVLEGATDTISRENPIVLIEYIKSDKAELAKFFIERDYRVWVWGGDFLCVPSGQIDAVLSRYRIDLPQMEI